MRVDIPNVLTLVKRNPDGGVYAVWFAAKAETFNSTPVFWKVVRNYGLDDDQKIIKMTPVATFCNRGESNQWVRKSLSRKVPSNPLILHTAEKVETRVKMENLIQSQDIPLVASQRPWLMNPLPVKGVDDALTQYLKLLRQHNIPANI